MPTSCVFIGYSDFQKGYRCYHPPTDTLYVTLDVSFRESEPYYLGGVSKSSLQGESHSKENTRCAGQEFLDLENLEEQLHHSFFNDRLAVCNNQSP